MPTDYLRPQRRAAARWGRARRARGQRGSTPSSTMIGLSHDSGGQLHLSCTKTPGSLLTATPLRAGMGTVRPSAALV
jgi:hypothetical protein